MATQTITHKKKTTTTKKVLVGGDGNKSKKCPTCGRAL